MEAHLFTAPIDILALDVSKDPFHLSHVGAKVLANHFEKSDLVPIHYGTYDAPEKPAHNGRPEEIIGQITNGYTRMKMIEPGEWMKCENETGGKGNKFKINGISE